MATLNEMANKLQTFIIESQDDSYNRQSMMNFGLAKYNNIKLAMDEVIRYPHIIIRIGMSEATYALRDNIRMEGGLGPDEKYIRKWLENGNNVHELNEIYKDFRVNLTAEKTHSESDDYAIEVDINGKIRRIYEARAAITNSAKMEKEERERQLKKELSKFLKSEKRKID